MRGVLEEHIGEKESKGGEIKLEEKEAWKEKEGIMHDEEESEGRWNHVARKRRKRAWWRQIKAMRDRVERGKKGSKAFSGKKRVIVSDWTEKKLSRLSDDETNGR